MAKQVRTNKKQYSAHSSIVIALMDHSPEILRTPTVGLLVEAVVASHLEPSSFWRSPQKEEVDMILKTKRGLLPVEVKYSSYIQNEDMVSLSKFGNKFGPKKALLVTKDVSGERRYKDLEATLFPAWFVLLAKERIRKMA